MRMYTRVSLEPLEHLEQSSIGAGFRCSMILEHARRTWNMLPAPDSAQAGVETRAAFARRMGVDPAHITRAAQAGRLVLTEDGKVLVEPSIERYRATEDPSPVGESQRERHARRRAEKRSAADPQPQAPAASDADRLRQARADRAQHEAVIARLTRERLEGELAETASIRDAGERLGIALRTRLENLPDHLAPHLTTQTDAERVHALLVEAVEQALAEISRELAEWVARLRAKGA